MIPLNNDAYRLMHEGCLALSEVEANGLRIDEDRLKQNLAKCERRVARAERRIKSDPRWKTWQKKFGQKASPGSRDQLAAILFEGKEVDPSMRTKSGKLSTKDEVLSTFNDPLAQSFVEARKFEKLANTYLKGTQRETVDGFCHAVFNLHFAISYRSSVDSPSLQNQPIRDPEMAKWIRSIYIARKDHRLVEIDFGGIEVRTAACYNHDPVLIEYICDSSKDMHRDMAAQCFCCEPDQVTKPMRHCGKNMFVFPQFYGDWYKSCAAAMWKAIGDLDIHTADNHPLKSWLRSQGIKSFDKFTSHIEKVEYDFWKRRFKVYDQWKVSWWEAYQKQAYFDSLTGFRYQGVFDKKNTINYPIQGSAFHCLLWSLIRLQRWLKRNKMRSKIVMQVHDSILIDVHKDEFDYVVAKAREIMQERLARAWGWIIVPLEVEVEASPVNGSWLEKEVVK